jgi:curved DNA-binding protein CbpA
MASLHIDSDLYKLLNVSSNVDDSHLKKAYYKLAMEYHPDKSTGNEDLFKKINNAYDILKDKDLRAKYDKMREEAVSGKYQSASNTRDYSSTTGQKKYSGPFTGGNAYGGFNSQQDFNKRATSGKFYEQAKAEWEQTHQRSQSYYQQQQNSYNQSSQQWSQGEGQKTGEQSHYKNYYRNRDYYAGSKGYENQQRKAEYEGQK